jgi:hypothetical protein
MACSECVTIIVSLWQNAYSTVPFISGRTLRPKISLAPPSAGARSNCSWTLRPLADKCPMVTTLRAYSTLRDSPPGSALSPTCTKEHGLDRVLSFALS